MICSTRSPILLEFRVYSRGSLHVRKFTSMGVKSLHEVGFMGVNTGFMETSGIFHGRFRESKGTSTEVRKLPWKNTIFR